MTKYGTHLVSNIKSSTGSFLGSCIDAQDKLTVREVKLVIIGRLGVSGTSCTINSIASVAAFSFT